MTMRLRCFFSEFGSGHVSQLGSDRDSHHSWQLERLPPVPVLGLREVGGDLRWGCTSPHRSTSFPARDQVLGG